MTIKEIAEKITNSIFLNVNDGEKTLARFYSEYYDSIKDEILDMEVEGIKVYGGSSRTRPTLEISVASKNTEDTDPGEEEPGEEEPDDDDTDDDDFPDNDDDPNNGN